MANFVVALLVTVIATGGMALGLALRGRPLRHGCRGAGRPGGACEGCGKLVRRGR
jgi:hypothetical protein